MNEATARFVRAHADDDVRQLALKGTKSPDVDLPYALDQIAGRQTARRKLPTWAATDGIVFPPHLSMEQCSSEQTARYKATIARRCEGAGLRTTRMVDLTGGFGVDFSFMAPAFDEAVYVERQPLLCDIARQNFRLLGLRQAEVVCGDAEDYLRQMPRADLIYIDPARRDVQGQRTYAVSDCTPNVLALRDVLLEKADRVVIKLSPMLDWRKAVNDLSPSPCVSEVHIVSVQNECKELLMVLGGRGREGAEVREVLVRCVNIRSDGTLQVFETREQPDLRPLPSSIFLLPSSLFLLPSSFPVPLRAQRLNHEGRLLRGVSRRFRREPAGAKQPSLFQRKPGGRFPWPHVRRRGRHHHEQTRTASSA